MSGAPLTDLLLSPPVLFTLAMGLLLMLVRSPWPWTRLGGCFLFAWVVAGTALALRHPHLRQLVLNPERLPVLLLFVLSAAALWVAFHQTLHASRDGEIESPESWRGLSSAELAAGGAAALGVAVCAFAIGAPLSARAELGGSAEDIAAPWFLLGLLELRGYFDPWVPAILLPGLAVAGLLLLPYLDNSAAPPEDGFDERRDVVLFFLFVWFLLTLLPMATGAFLRPFAAPSELPRPFSELVWKLVLEDPPRLVWLRELPGLLLLAAYFVVLPRQLPRWKPTRAIFGRYLKRLGRRRFNLGLALVLLWLLVPLKMYGRWLMSIEYFVYLPEIKVSF